eukprot:tig00000203_g17129.t1
MELGDIEIVIDVDDDVEIEHAVDGSSASAPPVAAVRTPSDPMIPGRMPYVHSVEVVPYARRLLLSAFRQLLQHAVRRHPKDEDPPCTLQLVCEAWTSKTCGMCGKINYVYTLGSKRVFECRRRPGCGFRADHDGGAARGILIRYGTGVDAKRLLSS